VNAEQKPGYYNLTWSGNDSRGHSLTAGIYFIRLRAGDATVERKVVLLK
jgi:hypothetical protein